MLRAAVAAAAIALATLIAPSAVPQSDPCTKTIQPGQSFKKFLKTLQDGDVGCLNRTVSPGYTEITRGGVTLQGGAVNGTLDFRESADGFVLRNIRVDGKKSGYAITTLADDMTISGTELSSKAGHSCIIVGRSDGVAERLTVSRNRIHNCGVKADKNKSHGVYLYSARDALVEDNVIYDVLGGYGLQIWGDVRGSYIGFNTLDGTGSNRGGMAVGSDGTQPRDNTIERNILAHTTGIVVHGGSGLVNRDNCVTNDPRFVDRAGHDYRLRPDSPCVGKGVRG